MPYDAGTALLALLRSSPDFIFFHDREGRYRYVSEAAARVFGRTPDQMTGLTTADLGVPDEVSAHFHQQRVEVMTTGRSIRDETSYESADGTLHLDYVIAPVIADGESLGVVVVTREVTARRGAEQALRESEAKFSKAFDHSPLALTITSLDDGTLVEVNEGFTKMSGYTRDEAIGRRPEELGLWIDPDVRAQRFALMLEGKRPPDTEAQFRVKSGEILTGYIGSAVVEINGRRCVLSSVVDISERKRAEEAKDVFLATLSHELRTPLTSAYGWVKLLAKTTDPELTRAGLRAIDESITAQIRLIDDLLDVSRIAVGKMHLDMQPLDLGAVVDSAVEMIRHAADAKMIDVRVQTKSVLTLVGDTSRLKQVVWNLLSNAIKFTPDGGTVDVEIREVADYAEIVIRDTGEGIDPKFLPHVFDRFRQADSSISRKHGGLGIGLSIVASVVDAHNGSVSAHSDGEGKGATFIVTLPLLRSSQSSRPTFTSSPTTSFT